MENLNIKGCFKQNEKFIYNIDFNGWSGNRSYGDFLRLSHKVKKIDLQSFEKQNKKPIPGIPKKSLTVLGNGSPWVNNGDGWKVEYTASVRRIVSWLQENILNENTKADIIRFLSDEFESNNTTSCFNQAEEYARDFQQYYCVEENLEALVTASLVGLNIRTVSQNHEYDDNDEDDDDKQKCFHRNKFLLVEPSCGDGRILSRMIDYSKRQHNNSKSQALILDQIVAAIGIDLDERAVSETQAALQDNNFSPYYLANNIPIYCGDFLKTQSRLLGQLLEFHRGISHHREAWPPMVIRDCEIKASSEALHDTDGEIPCPLCQRLEVLVVGGPPYTDYNTCTSSSCSSSLSSLRGDESIAKRAKLAHIPSSSSPSPTPVDEDGFRTLPLRFILHAARPVSEGGLGATRVAYLLPQRCAKERFQSDLRKGLGEFNFDGEVRWDISCQPAPNKNFLFRDRLVPQPSIIFVLDRVMVD